MAFIESRLFWEGQIGRRMLMEAFYISKPQATLEFKKYRECCPGNIEFDVSLKCYIPTSKFRPEFYRPDANSYLTELRRIEEADGNFSSSLGEPPRHESIMMLKTNINADILRKVVHTMKNGRKMLVKYQGMERSETNERWIAPQNLFFDGIRWYIRAYCLLRPGYRTFNLSRILAILSLGDIEKAVPHDEEWSEIINVIIIPNPNLNSAQQEIISKEHGMSENGRVLSVRKSLLPYFLLANRLYPLDGGGNIVIKNVEEIKKAIKGKPIDMFR